MRRSSALVLALLLPGCLIDQERYDARLAALTDGDGDGVVAEDDCDDGDAAVHPGAAEVCDGLDQDCDEAVDEDAPEAPTWYADLDGDGHGDRETTRTGCDAPAGYVESADDCDDSSAGVHPGAEETAYDGVDQDCVGGDADDLDGDGYAGGIGGVDCDDADAAVHPGAEETWENGFSDDDCDGEVEQLRYEYGALVWSGEAGNLGLGRAVAGAGDLDQDGLADVLIGSEFDPSVGANAGIVYVVDGPPGVDLSSSDALLPIEAGAWFAANLDAGVDVDGDGVGDILVNAMGSEVLAGAAWLVSGKAWQELGTATVDQVSLGAVQADAAGTYGPTDVRFVGDVTGDGVEDLALGECCSVEGRPGTTGRVVIFSSDRFAGNLADAEVTIDGPWEGAYFGMGLHRISDQDGDGLDDILVSSTGGIVGTIVPATGGGSSTDVALAVIYDEGESGLVAENAGDLNADGADDVAVAGGEERLYFFTSLRTDPTWGIQTPSFTLRWPEQGAVPGVVPLGDRDGDGHDELFVAQAYSGSGTQRAWFLPGGLASFGADLTAEDMALNAISVVPEALFGYSSAFVGDVDGDGFDDIAIGGPDYSGGSPGAGGVTIVPVPE